MLILSGPPTRHNVVCMLVQTYTKQSTPGEDLEPFSKRRYPKDHFKSDDIHMNDTVARGEFHSRVTNVLNENWKTIQAIITNATILDITKYVHTYIVVLYACRLLHVHT